MLAPDLSDRCKGHMVHNSTYDDLKKQISLFNSNHRRPHGDIFLTELIDISKEERASWPSNESPGVYIFLDAEKHITYIGKASFDNCIGARLNSRFDTRWNPKKPESQGCVFITTIALPNDLAFEASAIEEYLLKKLKTRSNRVGNS